MKYIKMINAQIQIVNGEIRVNSMQASGKEVTDEIYQLMHLKTILDDTIFNFEKNYQKRFIPTGETVYILPKEE